MICRVIWGLLEIFGDLWDPLESVGIFSDLFTFRDLKVS